MYFGGVKAIAFHRQNSFIYEVLSSPLLMVAFANYIICSEVKSGTIIYFSRFNKLVCTAFIKTTFINIEYNAIYVYKSFNNNNQILNSFLKIQDRNKASFQQGDACKLSRELGQFGCILAANLICRLQTPKTFFDSLKYLTAPGGIVIITSPYTFLREFTPSVCMHTI